jgi:tetratricopeptide (TPR) repeat protein
MLVTFGTAGAPAFADDVSSARAHYRKATNAFELGNFDESIREYTEAYRLKDDPAILYNLGQAHRLADHPAEALHFYKMYLTKVPGAPNHAEVESKIESLQSQVELRKVEHPPAVVVAAPAPVPAVTSPVAPAPSRAVESRSAPPGRTKKIAGIVTGAVGVGLLGGGIALAALAKSAGDDLTRQAEGGTFSYDDEQRGKRDQLLSSLFLAVGGAAVVTGVVLYVIGHRESRRARSRPMALLPAVDSATAQVRF